MSIQNSVDTNDKDNSRLLEREQMSNTPFYLIGGDDIGWKITWGKYSFTDEPHVTKEDAYNWLNNNMWTVVIHIVSIGVAHGVKTMDKKEQ